MILIRAFIIEHRRPVWLTTAAFPVPMGTSWTADWVTGNWAHRGMGTNHRSIIDSPLTAVRARTAEKPEYPMGSAAWHEMELEWPHALHSKPKGTTDQFKTVSVLAAAQPLA